MCGIVGAIAERNIVPVLVEGLKRLEYRGYDSAGLAVVQGDRKLGLCRTVGKVAQLESKLARQPLAGRLGVAHTRWATHGGVTEANAHPHLSGDRVAVIHNGIIENYEPLRDELIAKGYEFKSETDTEVTAHLDSRLPEAGSRPAQRAAPSRAALLKARTRCSRSTPRTPSASSSPASRARSSSGSASARTSSRAACRRSCP